MITAVVAAFCKGGSVTSNRSGLRLLLLFLVVLLAGCAVLEEPSEEAGAPGPEPREEATPAPDDEPGTAAVERLMIEARDASDDGDHERAGALLERALRIAPDSAVLWHNLAIVRYREEAYDQAEQLAQRSLSHADGNAELQRRNWEIIAVSRHMNGDADGAEAARSRAAGLQEAGGD